MATVNDYYRNRIRRPAIERAVEAVRARQAACPHESTGIYIGRYDRNMYTLRCMVCRADLAQWEVRAGDWREVYHFQNPPRRPTCSPLTSG